MNYGFFAHDIEKRRPSRENSLLWFVKCQAYIVEVRKEKKPITNQLIDTYHLITKGTASNEKRIVFQVLLPHRDDF